MGDDPRSVQAYWDQFYASRSSEAVPTEPSSFARWVSTVIDQQATIVEVGFGTARDSLWFANAGHRVLGFDFAASAVKLARPAAESQGLDAAFAELNLYSSESVAGTEDLLRELGGPLVVYGRFLIHSLREEGRWNLLDLASRVLPGRGQLLLEFRTKRDASETHIFGDDHFRTFVDAQVVVAEIGARGGSIDYVKEGYGLAVYKSEDPHVARIAASWSGSTE